MCKWALALRGGLVCVCTWGFRTPQKQLTSILGAARCQRKMQLLSQPVQVARPSGQAVPNLLHVSYLPGRCSCLYLCTISFCVSYCPISAHSDWLPQCPMEALNRQHSPIFSAWILVETISGVLSARFSSAGCQGHLWEQASLNFPHLSQCSSLGTTCQHPCLETTHFFKLNITFSSSVCPTPSLMPAL